ncbi:MAG: glycoside hydrolase family 5 protein [Prevotella sp.]
MKAKGILIVVLLSFIVVLSNAQTQLPDLRVQGKNLVDENGNTVVLHGVMDTPNRYFNNWRWQSWKATYGDDDVQPCLDYFDKLFTAITDHEQGAYCTVFRLHLDPCWTNDPSKTQVGDGGEQNISQFSSTRLTRYWKSLYSKIMESALAHGLYVILRPPGVCPNTIKVGDEYQQYLTTVWGTICAANVLKNNAGKVSIELANEPINVRLADGSESKNALHDFFQPVVDVIREKGFTGIIWVPGSGWQSQYADYAATPILDNNFGYAVHVYPGWYGASDNSYNHQNFINQFHAQVPVVDTNPIMVTEIDWSPENPDGEGKYNEWGEWVKPNYGTWGTASTSKWGNAWKAVHDHYGNIGMTLTSTDDLIDIDEYLASGKVQPNFSNAKANGLYEECCAYTCFQWYKAFYEAQTAGIESIEDDYPSPLLPPHSTKFYDLQGRPVGSNYRGICIKSTDEMAKKGKKGVKCNIR